MSYCKNCDKDTQSYSDKFKDVVRDKADNYLTVHVYSCDECGEHKDDESWIE